MAENELVQQFHEEMVKLYRRIIDECKYKPMYFLYMISELGGLKTAKMLINAVEPSEMFFRIRDYWRLDLSVEAYALKGEFSSLFTEKEKELAKSRLEKFGWTSRKEESIA